MPDITEVTFVDRETILNSLFEVVNDSSTWISECQLSESDKEGAIICLAEISGAVRLVKKLLKLDEIKFDMTVDADEDDRS